MHSDISVVLSAEHIGSVFGFPITNALLMTWLVMALVIGFAVFLRSRLALVPGKLQTTVEWGLVTVHDFVRETLGNDAFARRFFPLIATIFIFVFIGNELAFLPGIGSVGITHEDGIIPLLRAPATDLNFTLALACISFLAIEIAGVAAIGFLNYGRKFLNFASPLAFVVGVIELFSEVARLISFSFRLFGNIFAGEVMILVASFFLAYLLPVPIMAFEVFVGFIQAAIFALLTLFFAKIATEMHEAH
jgi:F-type H+-transporting ATPase subunit a